VTDLVADEAALVTKIATICHGGITITAKFAESKEKSRGV